MLEEAVAIIRELWSGDLCSHDGRFFTVDRARIYSLPDTPRPSTWRRPEGRRAVSPVGSEMVS